MNVAFGIPRLPRSTSREETAEEEEELEEEELEEEELEDMMRRWQQMPDAGEKLGRNRKSCAENAISESFISHTQRNFSTTCVVANRC